MAIAIHAVMFNIIWLPCVNERVFGYPYTGYGDIIISQLPRSHIYYNFKAKKHGQLNIHFLISRN